MGCGRWSEPGSHAGRGGLERRRSNRARRAGDGEPMPVYCLIASIWISYRTLAGRAEVELVVHAPLAARDRRFEIAAADVALEQRQISGHSGHLAAVEEVLALQVRVERRYRGAYGACV